MSYFRNATFGATPRAASPAALRPPTAGTAPIQPPAADPAPPAPGAAVAARGPASATGETGEGSAPGAWRRARVGEAKHRSTPYERPAPAAAAAPIDAGAAGQQQAPATRRRTARTASPSPARPDGESKSASQPGLRMAQDRAMAHSMPHAPGTGDPAAPLASSLPASASASAPAAPGDRPVPGAHPLPAAPTAAVAPQNPQAVRAAGLAALNPATFPQVPWRSEAWNTARAEGRAALQAWYGTCSEAERRSALSQAFEVGSFPAKSQGQEAHDQARAVRLTQMEVLIGLMSAEARARDLASTKTESALPGTGCPTREFEKRRELYSLHLMAHHEHMTPAQRRASWAEAIDMERLGAPVSRTGGRRRWLAMLEVPVQVAHAYLPDEVRARVHWDLLDPTPFVELGWGKKPSVTGFRRHLWAWEMLVQFLPKEVQLDILFGAIATPTPTCRVPVPTDQLRVVRVKQMATLIKRDGLFNDPATFRRFCNWISLPPFAPGQEHWDFAAAFRATAAGNIYRTQNDAARLAHWSAVLGTLELPPAPRDAVARPNAMRQRLDHIAVIADRQFFWVTDAQIVQLWERTRDPSTMPSRDTAPQAWQDVLAIRAFAQEQLRPSVGPALREAILARLGGGAPPSLEAFAADARQVGDDAQVLDVLGALVMTQDPLATPPLSRRLLGRDHGPHIGGVVWLVDTPQELALLGRREGSFWRLPDVGAKLPKAD